MTSVPSWTALARLTDRRAKWWTPSGHRAGLLSLDICQSAVVDAVAQGATGVAGGRVDVLVNNVGDYRPSGRFLKTTDDEWNALYSLNLEHVFRGTRAIAPAMVANQSGSIVNVSTVEAFRGYPATPSTPPSTPGSTPSPEASPSRLGRDGVRVNAIAPDLADTLQTPAAAMLRGRDPEMVRHWVPLGRFGRPDDYADVVLFLASPMSRFVTGHVIPVDGGTTAASGWYLRTDERGWTNLPNAP
jgi:2-hydroxycyclohexanecarboxyl-CoA dehydrogenase